MAVDVFIKIDDIKGESTDDKHKDEIEVISWSWGMTQTGSSHFGTGSGTARVDVHNLTFTKYIDLASPNLLKFCCAGTHFKLAKLCLRKASGNSPIEYLTLELHNGIVASVTMGGASDGDRFTETVGLNFSAFKYNYIPQVKGAAGGGVPCTWNIARNCDKV